MVYTLCYNAYSKLYVTTISMTTISQSELDKERIDKRNNKSSSRRIEDGVGRKEQVVKVVEEMKKAEIKILRDDEWEIEGELLLKERKVYIRVEDNKLCLFYFYISFIFLFENLELEFSMILQLSYISQSHNYVT